MSHSSIGIIGGADGPTKIILSGNPLPMILAAVAIVAIAAGIVVILKRKK